MVTQKDKPTRSKGVREHLRRKILEMYNYRCVKCGYKFLEIHHIDGNPANDSIENLEVICKLCHIEKHWHGRTRDMVVMKLKTLIRTEISGLIEKEIKKEVGKILDEIGNLRIYFEYPTDKKSKSLRAASPKSRIETVWPSINIYENIKEEVAREIAFSISRLIVNSIEEKVVKNVLDEIRREQEIWDDEIE